MHKSYDTYKSYAMYSLRAVDYLDSYSSNYYFPSTYCAVSRNIVLDHFY